MRRPLTSSRHLRKMTFPSEVWLWRVQCPILEKLSEGFSGGEGPAAIMGYCSGRVGQRATRQAAATMKAEDSSAPAANAWIVKRPTRIVPLVRCKARRQDAVF